MRAVYGVHPDPGVLLAGVRVGIQQRPDLCRAEQHAGRGRYVGHMRLALLSVQSDLFDAGVCAVDAVPRTELDGVQLANM